MSSACLDKMIIEDDSELAPKLKKMKLCSGDSPQNKIINRTNLINSDPKKHLMNVYPYFSEEVNKII